MLIMLSSDMADHYGDAEVTFVSHLQNPQISNLQLTLFKGPISILSTRLQPNILCYKVVRF